MTKKTVNITFEEVQPVYLEIVEFLFNKYGKNPPLNCSFSPDQLALLLGAIKLTEKYLIEEIKGIEGSTTCVLDSPLS